MKSSKFLKQIIDRFGHLPAQITNSFINSIEQYSAEAIWKFVCADLSNFDLSNVSPELLGTINFSSKTIWPTKEKLPKSFDARKILKNGMFIGCGFEKAHKLGFTGKGIAVAAIDKPFEPHEATVGVKEYVVLNKKHNHIDFHGLCVASKIFGKKFGVAPDCNSIFYGSDCGGNKKVPYNTSFFEGILECLEDIKRRINNGEQIRIISLSTSFSVCKNTEIVERSKKLYAELEALNCTVIDSPRFWKHFSYCDLKDCFANIKDIEQYQQIEFSKNLPNVLCGGKNTPLFGTKSDYIYEARGCASWSIPQVAGFYALALQINPNIKFDDFAQIAKNTADKNKAELLIVNAERTLLKIAHQSKIKQKIE